VRRGRIGAELVMPPVEERPYYLQRNLADLKTGVPSSAQSAAKPDAAKKPEAKEESEEESEEESDEEE
jgi:hypothetical protein